MRTRREGYKQTSSRALLYRFNPAQFDMVSKDKKAEQAQQVRKDHARAITLWGMAQGTVHHSATVWCAAVRFLNEDPLFDLHNEDPLNVETILAAIDAQVTATARAVAASKEAKATHREAFARAFKEYVKSQPVHDQPGFIPPNLNGMMATGIASLTVPAGGPKKDLTTKLNEGKLLPRNGEEKRELLELFNNMMQLLRDQSERMDVFAEAFEELPYGPVENEERLLKVIQLAGVKSLANAAAGVIDVNHAKSMIRKNLNSIELYLKDTKKADATQKKADEDEVVQMYQDAIHIVTLAHCPGLVSDTAARRAVLLKVVNRYCPKPVKVPKPTTAAPGEDGEAAAADVPQPEEQPVPQPVVPSLEVSLIRDIAKVSRSMSPNRRIRNNRSRSPRVGSSESPK